MIHKFQSSTEGVALPEKFTCPFCYTPHPLCVMAAEEVQGYLSRQPQWAEELAKGKMFGVLVVRTAAGEIGYLAAYSGILAHSNKHDFFVPPVFDLLDPEGFFVTEEKQISKINEEIEKICGDGAYSILKEQLAEEVFLSERKLKDAKYNIKLAKTERDKRRLLNPDEKALAEMISESQFAKAELKRLERSMLEQVGLLRVKMGVYEEKINVLMKERKVRSFALQRKLFDNFCVLNAKEEEQSLYEIFEKSIGRLPPAGAGECAAPKLLQYAYRYKLRPLAMAEFWWEKIPEKTILQKVTIAKTADGLRRHGYFYPACKSKCEPILNFMMQGLDVDETDTVAGNCSSSGSCYEPEIIFEDEWIVVVNKPAGMLSVPGKGNKDSVFSLMKQLYPEASGPLIVHRLDMDTSGLMVIAKTKEAHKEMQKLFASGRVEKCYVAILDGAVESDEGEISLPLCPDPEDRPRQVVNYEYGKPAITRYQVINRTKKNSSQTESHCEYQTPSLRGRVGEGLYTTVIFYPKTGRTHQLRVHAAHRKGLNTPIKGDRLYGQPSNRLYLHAKSLKFNHPVTGVIIHIEKEEDF